MKNIKYITFIILGFLVLTFSCQEDDSEFGRVVAPSNINITAEIQGFDANNPNGDGSGLVKFTVTADNALSYNFQYGDGMEESAPSGITTHRFTMVGINTYNVVVNAVGTGGISTSATITLTVLSDFDDPELKQFLTNGSTKTWYLAASEIGHLGVGPTLNSPDPNAINAFWYPQYYAAQPFEKCGPAISNCLCDDEFTFSLDANGNLTYQLNNNGQTFFNAGHQGVIGQNAGEDACFDFDTSGTSMVSLAPTSTDWSQVGDPDFEFRGTQMNFSPFNFMGYYVSSSSYEVIEITNSFLYVRTIDGLNPSLAWYHKFSSSPPNEGTSDYNDLVWEDDFNTDGAPDATKWSIETGTGSNGWGNGEEQYYTGESDNVIVNNGTLKITAKKESFLGNEYTSSRIKSENLFEFTYGRVEVSAKLPTGGGTWPAIWMLGEDYVTNTWPGCGEIDIMEHVGNQQNTIHGTLHYPGNSGGNGNGNSTTIDNASTEFHTYEVEWSPTSIKFFVDGNQYHTFANSPGTPFNSDFFLIINVAMGGNFGGNIDPNFSESTLEVDYIKVYQ